MESHPILYYVVAIAQSPLEAEGYPLLVITARGPEATPSVDLFLLRGWDQRSDVAILPGKTLFESFLSELHEHRVIANQRTTDFLRGIDDLQIGDLRSFASGSCDPSTLGETLSAVLADVVPAITWPDSFRYEFQLADQVSDSRVVREKREAQTIQGYRTGTLTQLEARQSLGLSRFEFDGFLKERHIFEYAYGVEDLLVDLETLRRRDS